MRRTIRWTWMAMVALAACGDGGGAPSDVLADRADVQVATSDGTDASDGDAAAADGREVRADPIGPADAATDPAHADADATVAHDGTADEGIGPDPSKDAAPDAVPDAVGDTAPTTCGFAYPFPAWAPGTAMPVRSWVPVGPDGEPDPPFVYAVRLAASTAEIVFPGDTDDMPLFERANEWVPGETRCYELPSGPASLDQEQAFLLYRDIAEKTAGRPMRTDADFRTVVGIRGAYPGTFSWNGNGPNRFNDTLVLMWRDAGDAPHVLEFAGHTDTGAWNWGAPDSASSLWPNRRYPYACGTHKTYSALVIQEDGYRVRDDTNFNGHWDSDRNGWLPPQTGAADQDHDRGGNAHNIHVASVDGPLDTATVDNHSAGCQNIPGMASWRQFITNAWTAYGNAVDYYLVDARDIDPTVWGDCTPDGSHECPWRIGVLPFTHQGDTTGREQRLARYSCATDRDESGPEALYVLNVAEGGTLTATVTCDAATDMDVQILMGDDENACLARDDTTASAWVPPGRYVIAVDTFAGSQGARPGPYTLDVSLVPGAAP